MDTQAENATGSVVTSFHTSPVSLELQYWIRALTGHVYIDLESPIRDKM